MMTALEMFQEKLYFSLESIPLERDQNGQYNQYIKLTTEVDKFPGCLFSLNIKVDIYKINTLSYRTNLPQ